MPGPTYLKPAPQRTWGDFLEDPTYSIRKKFHDMADDTYGPAGNDWLPTDLLGLFSQDWSGENGGFAPGNAGKASEAVSTLIPRNLIKKFAEEQAEANFNRFKNVGADKIAEAVGRMSELHPGIASHLAGIFPEPNPGVAGVFYDGSRDNKYIKGLISQDHSLATIHPDEMRAFGRMPEEERAKIAIKSYGPSVGISPNMENYGKAQIYSTIRHEFSHANDAIFKPTTQVGRGGYYPSDDFRYWLSPQEVRARAVEKNYARDMGYREPVSQSSYEHAAYAPDISNSGYEDGVRREPYGNKIATEIANGVVQAKGIMGRLKGVDKYRVRLAPVHNAKINNEAIRTFGSYFSPRGMPDPNDFNETIIKPARLKNPIAEQGMSYKDWLAPLIGDSGF